jgi:hypothetical protein
MSCQHFLDVGLLVVFDRDVDVLFKFTEEVDWRNIAVFDLINVNANRIEEGIPIAIGKLSIKSEVDLVPAAISQIVKSSEVCCDVHVVTFW